MESGRQVNDRSQKWHLQMSAPLGIHDLIRMYLSMPRDPRVVKWYAVRDARH